MNFNSIKIKILYFSIVPMLIMGIFVCMYSFIRFNNYSSSIIPDALSSKCLEIEGILDAVYPGEYIITDNTFSKGSASLEDMRMAFENMADDDVISLVYNNERIASSDEAVQSSHINDDIFSTLIVKNYCFNPSVSVNGKRYYLYTKILKNDSGNIFALEYMRPASVISKQALSAMLPVLILTLIVSIVMSVIAYYFTAKITNSIIDIRYFVGEISQENLDERLDDETYKRDDEIGDIGRDISVMRDKLKDLIEIDTLTQLYNRKTGEKKLNAIRQRTKSRKQDFCLAIGDIDHFKKVNDTYGHDAGDEVLKMVAQTINKTMQKYGFVARWGGEEFMIGFENASRDKAEKILNDILDNIRKAQVKYGQDTIKVTMSFGVVKGTVGKSNDTLFTMADKKLYWAKEHGRNQVVSIIPKEKPVQNNPVQETIENNKQ